MMSDALPRYRGDAHFWRARIADGGLEGRERAEFQRWMAEDPSHAAAFAESEILWEALGAIEYDADILQPMAGEREAFYESWLHRLSQSLRAPLSVTLAAGSTIAAVILIGMLFFDTGGGGGVDYAPVEFATGHGESRQINLDDGTRLFLGPRTRMSVHLTPTMRNAELLSGNAYFDVQPDASAPFRVTIGAAHVQVLGTAFDLNRRSDEVTVAVAEGEVRVSHPRLVTSKARADHPNEWRRGGSGFLDSVALKAGESIMASRAKGLGKTVPVAVTDVGAWRRGQLVYLNVLLSDVVADLRRYASFDVRLGTGAASLRLSGTFAADDPDALLEALTIALPIQVLDENGDKRIVLEP